MRPVPLQSKGQTLCVATIAMRCWVQAAAVKFERAIADSKLIWLPGVGHTPHWGTAENSCKIRYGFS